jgi:hypothetical protein
MSEEPYLRDLIADVLDACTEDHCLLAWIAADIQQAAPRLTDGEVKCVTMAILKSLLEAGLIQMGVPDGSAFHREDASPEETLRRIDDHWGLPIDDADDVQYSLWVSATPSGEAVARGETDDAVLDHVASAANMALRVDGCTRPPVFRPGESP